MRTRPVKLGALVGVAWLMATPAAAQVILYEGEGFRGGAIAAHGTIPNLAQNGFNDRASSAIVERGRWEVCEHAGFDGPCVVLRPGNYPSLASLGMNNQISSVRPLGTRASYYASDAAPAAGPVYEYRRRPNERLYEVNVASARAVVGPPEQRCWVEREQVVEPARSEANVPGAIVGAIVGGVLGHQIGGGRGQDIATAGGAVAGAAIGANTGRITGSTTSYRDVQRCANVSDSARPAYWDVTYYFRGQQHHIQMAEAPGPTLWVNGRGEPRG